VIVAGGGRGLAVVEGTAMRVIDALPTVGLDVRGPLLYRRLRGALGAESSLAVYDEFGIRNWARVDADVAEPSAVPDEASRVATSIVPPAFELRAVAVVTPALLRGLQIAFDTNATRVAQTQQLAMFAAAGVAPHRLWATSEPLPLDALGATLRADLSNAWPPGAVVAVPCSATNRGRAIYVTAPPNPVQFCYRWYDGGGEPVDAGAWIHTPLPRALPPGVTIDATVRVKSPDRPGRYTLALTLLQEDVAWFDDVDPTWGVRAAVVVGAA
jgi:hypothetical protein